MPTLILKASSPVGITKGFRTLADGTLAEIVSIVTSESPNVGVLTDADLRLTPQGYTVNSDGTMARNVIVVDGGAGAADLSASSTWPRRLPLAYRQMPDGSYAQVLAAATGVNPTAADVHDTVMGGRQNVTTGFRALGGGLYAPIVAMATAGSAPAQVKRPLTSIGDTAPGYVKLASGNYAEVLAGQVIVAPEHAYWRARFTASDSGFVSIKNFRMFGTAGGANLCTGGTPIAEGTWSGTTPANAFNEGATGTGWSTEGALPAWLGYQFAEPVKIVQYALEAPIPNQGPRDFEFQYSDDGLAWTTVDSHDLTSWSVNPLQTFDVPQV